MAHFVDRRLNPKEKSLGNRRRFIRRVRAHVKHAVDESVRAKLQQQLTLHAAQDGTQESIG